MAASLTSAGSAPSQIRSSLQKRRSPSPLWREAYRRLGYNPKLVKLELADLPADNSALMARIHSYMDQVQNLSRAAAHASTDAAQSAGSQMPAARPASSKTDSQPPNTSAPPRD